MTFAFAHCRTVCPVVVRTVREAAHRLGGAATVVVVTLDPWRDRPSALPSMLTAWQLDDLPAAHVLSGEVEQVLKTLDVWNMPIQRDERTGDVTHPALVYVVAADGALAYSFHNPPVEWVVEAVERLDASQPAGMGAESTAQS